MSKSLENQEGAPQRSSSNLNLRGEADKVSLSKESESIEDTRKVGALQQQELHVNLLNLKIHQDPDKKEDPVEATTLKEDLPPFKYFTSEEEASLSPAIESKSNKLFEIVTHLVINQKKAVLKTLASRGGWITLKKENPKVLLRHLRRIPPPPLLSMAPEASPSYHASLAWPANGTQFGEEELSKLRLVFEAGWKRETVIMSCGPKGQKTARVHYYSPTRMMLKSPREVERWLQENEPGGPFTLDNFSFERVRISKDPDEEIVREMFPLKPPAPTGQAVLVRQRPPLLRHLHEGDITGRMFMELTSAAERLKISSISKSKLSSNLSSSLRKAPGIRRAGLSPLTPRVRTAFRRFAGGGGFSQWRKLPVSSSAPNALQRVNAAFPRLQKKWLANKNKRRGVLGGGKMAMTLKPVILAAPLLSKKVATRRKQMTAVEPSPNVTGRVFKVSKEEEVEQLESQDDLALVKDME